MAERVRRAVRTVWFMVVMVASLPVASAPALVAAGDVAVALWLEVRLGCFHGHGLQGHLQQYRFRSSLADIPLVSILRSLVITCKPSHILLGTLTDASKRASGRKVGEPVARLSWINGFPFISSSPFKFLELKIWG